MPLEGGIYRVKEDGKSKKGHIYSKELIEEIIEEYDLDFERKISITFHRVKYFKKDKEIYGAFIKPGE